MFEAVKAHAVLVGVDVSQCLGDHGIRGDAAASGVALGNVVERGCRVEDVDVVPLHEAGGAGPFGVADGGVVQEQVSAVVPLVLGRVSVGLAEEITDPGVPVPLVEAVAGVAVGNEGEDDVPALVADLVGVLVGQGPGVPNPHVVVHRREVRGDFRHRDVRAHGVLARGHGGAALGHDLLGVCTRPFGREGRGRIERLLGVFRGQGKAGRRGRHLPAAGRIRGRVCLRRGNGKEGGGRYGRHQCCGDGTPPHLP